MRRGEDERRFKAQLARTRSSAQRPSAASMQREREYMDWLNNLPHFAWLERPDAHRDESYEAFMAVRRAEPWVDVVGFTQKRRHENVEIINVDGCVGLARRERERLARFQGTHSHIPPTSRP